MRPFMKNSGKQTSRPRRPRRPPGEREVRFSLDAEVRALADMWDRLVEGNGEPWMRPLAAYATMDLVLDIIAALHSRDYGPRLDSDAFRIEPDRHLPEYLRMYAEAWLDRARRTRDGGWWTVRHLRAIDADDTRVRNSAGEERTFLTLVPDEEARSRMLRIAWRIWQTHIRSGSVLGPREWQEGLAVWLAGHEDEFEELRHPPEVSGAGA